MLDEVLGIAESEKNSYSLVFIGNESEYQYTNRYSK